MTSVPVDNFGTLVGENLRRYGILAVWTVNGLSIVCWGLAQHDHDFFLLNFRN